MSYGQLMWLKPWFVYVSGSPNMAAHVPQEQYPSRAEAWSLGSDGDYHGEFTSAASK